MAPHSGLWSSTYPNILSPNYALKRTVRTKLFVHTHLSSAARPFSLGVMRTELAPLVPRHKSDLQVARDVEGRSFAEVEPIVPALLEWTQDRNWPVARTLCPFFASIGVPLVPYLRRVFATDDESWKYEVIVSIIRPSLELCSALSTDLQRMVDSPTAAEEKEEVNVVASEALASLAGDGNA